MRLAMLLISGLFAFGCSAPGDRHAAADTPAPSAAGVPAPESVAASAASAPRGPHAADPACADVRALAERTLGIALAADSAPSFDAPRELGRWSGCRYTAAFVMTPDSVPSNLLHAALAASGWRSDDDWGADGADGSEYAFVRDAVLCHLSFMSPDAGDEQAHDDAPAGTAAGSGNVAYQLEIRCTSPVPALRTAS